MDDRCHAPPRLLAWSSRVNAGVPALAAAAIRPSGRGSSAERSRPPLFRHAPPASHPLRRHRGRRSIALPLPRSLVHSHLPLQAPLPLRGGAPPLHPGSCGGGEGRGVRAVPHARPRLTTPFTRVSSPRRG